MTEIKQPQTIKFEKKLATMGDDVIIIIPRYVVKTRNPNRDSDWKVTLEEVTE